MKVYALFWFSWDSWKFVGVFDSWGKAIEARDKVLHHYPDGGFDIEEHELNKVNYA